MALALYVGLSNCASPNDSLSLYVKPFVSFVDRIAGRDHPYVFIPIVAIGVVVMLCWPQVMFALIGGYLSRRFKVTVTRR